MRTFDEMIRSSYDFNADDYFADKRWAILERMYLKNYAIALDHYTDPIPKIIHQIWLGSEVPEKLTAWRESWQKFNPDWECHLWEDGSEKIILDSNRLDIFYSITNMGQRSDFLRYHILNHFGGIYVDTDFECLKSFDTLSYLSFFTGVGYPRRPELYIGLIASIPHHPIIENIVSSMTEIRQGGWKDIFETTGSYFFTRKFFETVGEYMQGVVAFPFPFFYPFPNQAGHEKKNGLDYIQEESYAVHHWDVSWRSK